MDDQISLSFGACSPPIEEQLQSQGLRLALSPIERRKLQQHADSVRMLFIDAILSEAETKRAETRIMKIIGKHIKSLNIQP
jgi:uncharacterized protein YaaW (UPF0174 family)